MSVTRAAFDVGSGATKLTVAKVDIEQSIVQEILFEEETEVLLGHDFKQSSDGSLSDAILKKAFNAIKSYQELAKSRYCAETFTGIATAVFRESVNGASFINQVSQDLGICLKVIDQEEEGRLGYLTAVAAYQEECNTAVSRIDDVISWDSGGASFQICGVNENDRSALHVYQGRWGSSKVTHAMVADVQRRSFGEIQTCNPCTMDDVHELCRLVKESLTEAPDWLSKRLASNGTMVAIGGATSMFRIVNLATRSREFTSEAVWHALEGMLYLFPRYAPASPHVAVSD